jgi:hypothetical protein
MLILKFFLYLVFFIFLFLSKAHAADLTPLPPYDWSKVLKIFPIEQPNEGNQILHFSHRNKHYSFNAEAKEFVNTYLKNAKQLESDADVLKYASEAVKINGAYIELGTASGRTANFIAALNPTRKIHGFDSFFEGLPAKWVRPDVDIDAGTFAYRDKSMVPPPVLDNILLYNGPFNKTLPLFKKAILKDTPISFLHVDSDIYTSAKQAFDVLGSNIVPGTIIVFDEFYNYPNSKEHEFKAFQELVKTHNLAYEYIAYNINHEQVAVRIK